MAKRKGTTPLNLDSSDDNSEPDEPKPMVQASEAELKNRVMKVARRRLTKQPPEGGVFGTLSAAACLKSQPTVNLESTFAFLKNSGTGSSVPAPGLATLNSTNGKSPANSERSTGMMKSSSPSFGTDFSSKRLCTDSAKPGLNSNSLLPPAESDSLVPTNGDNKVSSSVDVKELTQKDASNPILEQVKILNVECLQWAQQHVDENPMVDLRPVFKDYNQHFEAILEEFHKSEASKPRESNASSETLAKLQNHIKTKSLSESNKESTKTEDSSLLNNIYSPDSDAKMKSNISQSVDRLTYFSTLLGNKSSNSETKPEPTPTPTLKPTLNSSSPSMSKGLDTNPKVPSFTNSPKPDANQKPSFSFGQPAAESPKLSSFPKPAEAPAASALNTGSFLKMPAVANNCFSNPSIFSKDSNEKKINSIFGNVAPTSSIFGSSNMSGDASAKDEEGEDEDQPPVVEVKPIVEEGSKYTARCKVFIKKEDNSYADKGVGTLSLKSLENSNKSQLVVRAESTLGNILVNVLLSKDLPIQRTGKNNVLLVCLPTPDCEPPPKVVLLRVKTGDEADELFNVLKDSQELSTAG